MPKTAVHEYAKLQARDYNVWDARQIGDMYAEAISKTSQDGADQQFRRRVFAPNLRHEAGSGLFGQALRHRLSLRRRQGSFGRLQPS